EDRGSHMLGWVVTFLIIALIAGILGFGGIAGASVEIAKIIFFIAVVLFLVSAIVGVARGRSGPSAQIDDKKPGADLRRACTFGARHCQLRELVGFSAARGNRPMKLRINLATSLADSSSAKWPASSTCTSALGRSRLSAAISEISNTGS